MTLFRRLLTVTTLILIGLLVWQSWPLIIKAFSNLSQINLWVLLLLLPVQLFSFWITTQVLFTFLTARGYSVKLSPFGAMRISLEFNFANHMLPAGGAAGITYTSWKLGSYGVPAHLGTMGQLVRFAVTFVSFNIMMLTAAGWMLYRGIADTALLISAGVVGGISILAICVGLFLLRRRRTLYRFSGLLVGSANWVLGLIRAKHRVQLIPVLRFFDGLYLETQEILVSPKSLLKPFLLSFMVNLADSMLYWVALLSFGVVCDPAVVFVGYGLATLLSIVITTPNGTGPYEAAMVGTLIAGGVNGSIAIAAVLVARVILMLATIAFGYGFYQHSVSKMGAPKLKKS